MKNKSAHVFATAFTLIELIVVVAIIGVLSTLVILNFSGAQASARDANKRSDLKQYQTALEVYANRSNGLYPLKATTTDLSTMCGGTELNLSNCPDSSMPGVNYNYQSNANGQNYVIWTTLERKSSTGVTNYFVVCSNGISGEKPGSFTISGGACPLP
jgi:prepilin-type N-terminal cleavage/methylation domain-containing protein